MIAKNTLIPYLTFADPDIAQSEKLIESCIAAGCSTIELGFPFSDPIADGPTIQASHSRALENTPDLSLDQLFASSKKLSQAHNVTFILMLAVNPVIRYGISKCMKAAKKSGIAALLIPDLPIEAATPFIAAAKQAGINLSFFVSPLTPDQRLKEIVSKSTGFIYLIADTGTTGERSALHSNLEKVAKNIKAIRDIPLAVGFGISDAKTLRKVWGFADAGIVGSALVKEIEPNAKGVAKRISDSIKKLLD